MKSQFILLLGIFRVFIGFFLIEGFAGTSSSNSAESEPRDTAVSAPDKVLRALAKGFRYWDF